MVLNTDSALSMGKAAVGLRQRNEQGTKNEMTIVTWEAQVDRAFQHPSELWVLRERRMRAQEATSTEKVSKHRDPLLAESRGPRVCVSMQASSRRGIKSHTKWSMTLGPQNGNWTRNKTWIPPWRKPKAPAIPTREAHTGRLMRSCSAGAYRWLRSGHRPCQSTRPTRLQQRSVQQRPESCSHWRIWCSFQRPSQRSTWVLWRKSRNCLSWTNRRENSTWENRGLDWWRWWLRWAGYLQCDQVDD